MWTAVARVAAAQFGVISLAQLVELGLTRGEIRGRLERGHLHSLHRGVYAVGHTRIVEHAHLVAALLAVGPEGFLSHRTSAAVWGLRTISVERLEVTVRSGKGRRPPLIVHRTAKIPDPADISIRNGLRVSSVPRLLIELAPRERSSEMQRLITQAVRKRILDFDAFELAVQRHAGRPGVGMLKDEMRAYRPKPERKSGFEIAFDDWLALHAEIPEPLRNIQIGPWEIDCYWPQERLAVELDGRAYHIAARDFEKDRLKDTDLQRRRIRPIRITELRFEHDRAGILDDLRAFMQLPA